MSKSIDKLVNDGFSLAKQERSLTDLALLSLKIALKAYFSTYQSIKHIINVFDPSINKEEDNSDFYYNNSYCEKCSETIVHFQHFAELVSG